MAEVRGHLLPVYVLADESGSMTEHVGELNAGLASLHGTLLAEPMAAAKVRFTIMGFSDNVQIRMRLADLRQQDQLPQVVARTCTNYGVAFAALHHHIPLDVATLKGQQYLVHRPAVFFLSDGVPTDDDDVWMESHRRLTDRNILAAAPNIIACGIGDAQAQTILRVATRPEYAFVSIAGAKIGASIAKFCTALTKSIVASGRSMGPNGTAELVVEKPEGFRMAIDII